MNDPETPATEIEINVLHFEKRGCWKFSKHDGTNIVETKYVFYGPCSPTYKAKCGYTFSEDKNVQNIHEALKNSQ